MSRADVVQAEAREPDSESGSDLAFDARIFGYPCVVTYGFESDHLVYGHYMIDGVDDIEDVAAFATIRAALLAKYGEGTDRSGMRPPCRPEDMRTFADMARAVAAGHLIAHLEWETVETRIVLNLEQGHDGHNTVVWVSYYDGRRLRAPAEERGCADEYLL